MTQKVMTGMTVKLGGSHARSTRVDETRRCGLAVGAMTGLNPLKAFAARQVTLPFDNGERPLVKYPQKRPMIGQTSRPPQLETPFWFSTKAPSRQTMPLFVRYHLAAPLDIDPDTFTLELKAKSIQSVQAVAQGHQEDESDGDRRRQSVLGQQPSIPIARPRWTVRQWCDGQRALAWCAAQARARTGRRAAGCEAGGVWRRGQPVSDKTPDLTKALDDMDHRRRAQSTAMLAQLMNGRDLPVINGFPLRLGHCILRHLLGASASTRSPKIQCDKHL